MGVRFKRQILWLAAFRLALGVGIGAFVIGLLNIARDPGLAIILLIAGSVFISIAVAGHLLLIQGTEE